MNKSPAFYNIPGQRYVRIILELLPTSPHQACSEKLSPSRPGPASSARTVATTLPPPRSKASYEHLRVATKSALRIHAFPVTVFIFSMAYD